MRFRVIIVYHDLNSACTHASDDVMMHSGWEIQPQFGLSVAQFQVASGPVTGRKSRIAERYLISS
eukprot:2262005-Rhodomonas_salina.1